MGTSETVMWVLESLNVITLSWVVYNQLAVLAYKVSPSKFVRDPLIVFFLANLSIALSFRSLLPLSFYKGDIHKSGTCVTFVVDFVPIAFFTLALTCLVLKQAVVYKIVKEKMQYLESKKAFKRRLFRTIIGLQSLIYLLLLARFFSTCFDNRIVWLNDFLQIHYAIYLLVEITCFVGIIWTFIPIYRSQTKAEDPNRRWVKPKLILLFILLMFALVMRLITFLIILIRFYDIRT